MKDTSSLAVPGENDSHSSSGEELPVKGRLGGIDFGSVRVGIAISDVNRSIASPLENYDRRDKDQDARYFSKLAASEEILCSVGAATTAKSQMEVRVVVARPVT